jgi:EmrB/QacA subfamily drug resistance transporter
MNAAQTQPYRRRWHALGVLAAALLVTAVGNTILNVALPTIQKELGASSSQLQWIVDGYLLVFAGMLLTAGSLGDRFGRRRALVIGLATFGAGSIFALFSSGAAELIASRALMGLGAAGIMPTTLSVISNIFPPEERPKAIAVWAAVAGLGVAIGPISGGWLIEHADWKWIFLVNLPLVVVLIAGAFALVPESKDPESPKLDFVGAGLSIAGLTSIVWALIEAPNRGWMDPMILAAFAVGGAIGAVFFWWEHRVEQPMLQVRVFRNLRFSAASASVAFVYFSLMGVTYFLTTYLQSVLGHSALGAGELMLAVAGGIMITARIAVPLTERIGTKIVVAVGLGVVAIGMYLFTTFGVDTSDAHVCAVIGLMGLGMGLTMSPATDAIMGSLPPAKAGVGSAMNDVVREVSGTLGVAVLGSILASSYSSSMDSAVSGLPAAAASSAGDNVGAAAQVAGQIGGSGGAHLIASANSAFVDAMSTTASIAAVIAIVGAVIAAVFLPARAQRQTAVMPTPEFEAAAA